VRRDVLRDALQPVLIGAIAGAACGAIFVLLIGRLFFKVDAIDFTTMLLTTIALVGLGWIVAAIPAQRASVIHPAQALRQE
jgi:ABC-type antimicrobial peptide transport system permease subunit